MQKGPREASAGWQFWVATELFGSMSRHGSLCRDMVLCVATWFLGCRLLLGCNRGFLVRDRVVFIWFSIATGVFLVTTMLFSSGFLSR